MMKKIFQIKIPHQRNFGLDLLRFIAIFTVLVSHSITVLPEKFYFVHKFITDDVLIFFVLSGFLIGRILIRDFEEKINIRNLIHFWKRRWWRTLPAYFFTIFLILLISFLMQRPVNWGACIKSLFFVQNLFYHTGAFFPESWSLSIEEWFYLSLPVLLFALFRISGKTVRQTVIISFFIILIFSVAIRLYILSHHEIVSLQEWDQRLRSPVVTRLDSILTGVLGAWFFHFKKPLFDKNKNVFFIAGALVFLLNKFYFDYFISFNLYTGVFYFFIMPASIVLMLPKFYYLKETRLPIFNRLITKGSLISYSMYLLNLTVISTLILQPLQINIWIKFFLFWVMTPLFSILMYKYVELPFMKLRDKK